MNFHTNQEILSKTDHTLLSPQATFADIERLCDEAIAHKTASVCIPPQHVAHIHSYVDSRVPICTVVGFPCGYSDTATKIFETEQCVKYGADEIDMVINIGRLKERDTQYVKHEIRQIKEAIGGKILKVIIETCLLTDEEKIMMCEIVSESGADFIKTSTGFSTGGATAADIELFKKHVAPHVKIKAAGGITTLDDAKQFIELGADRLGSSRIVKLVEEQSAAGY